MLAAGLIWMTASSAFAQPAAREFQVKAVFLFNFTQFVEWPPAAFSSPTAPLVIGILGEDPFGSLLEEAVRDEKAGEHPLQIRRFQKFEEVDCHVLYLSRTDADRVERVAGALAGKPIFTVSDVNQAARRGVMVQFLTESNRIRLRINLDATKRAGLTISSKLLRSAEIVGTKP